MYYVLEILVLLAAAATILYLTKHRQREPELKSLRIYSAIFAAAMLLDLTVIILLLKKVPNLTTIGVIIMKAVMAWYGLNAKNDKQYLTTVFTMGRVGMFFFGVMAIIQIGIGYAASRIFGSLSMMSGCIPGLIEMLLYVLLSYLYYKSGKEAAGKMDKS